jgi:hypothetical protein
MCYEDISRGNVELIVFVWYVLSIHKDPVAFARTA